MFVNLMNCAVFTGRSSICLFVCLKTLCPSSIKRVFAASGWGTSLSALWLRVTRELESYDCGSYEGSVSPPKKEIPDAICWRVAMVIRQSVFATRPEVLEKVIYAL